MKWLKYWKKWFSLFRRISHEKHPYVGRILKKWFKGSTHAQFYVVIKSPFGWFRLQPCTVSMKRCKNKVLTLGRCSILVKASSDRRVQKRVWTPSDQCLQHRHLQLTAANATVHIDTFTKLVILSHAAINRRSGGHLRMATDARGNAK